MIWAYYRVSTERQDYHSQKIGVDDYCRRNNLIIDKEVIDDGVSGTVKAKDRKLSKILKQAVVGDIVITSELSRFGRSTIDILDTCNIFASRGVKVIFLKQNMQLDNTPVGKLLTAIFAAFSELERDLIAARTREGIEKARLAGKKIGRPKGKGFRKLDIFSEHIKNLLSEGSSIASICRLLNVSETTLTRWLKEKNLYQRVKK